MLTVNSVTSYEVEDGVAIIVTDSPPVNALGAAVRKGIADALAIASEDDAVRAVVILCAGRTFYAGADISEIGKPMAEPTLRALQRMLEDMAKPVVAAIHGSALGGGLELAMAAHYRVAASSARCGLPEVNLGLLPGAGGTQRLPRLIGISNALELMLSGEAVSADKALDMGLFDRLILEGSLRADAAAFARSVAVSGVPAFKVRDRTDRLAASPGAVAEARGHIELLRARHGAFKARLNVIKCVENTLDLSFDEGVAAEAVLFEELKNSPQSAALRYVFFAERQAARPPQGDGANAAAIRKIALIGTGAMIDELVTASLAAGIAVNQAEKGGNVDLVIDATVSRPQHGLPDDEHAVRGLCKGFVRYPEDGPRPRSAGDEDRVDLDPVGLDFGSDSSVSNLMEVVQADGAHPQSIGALFRFAKQIGRVAVLSHGAGKSICERLQRARDRQIQTLKAGGYSNADVERALLRFGFVTPSRREDVSVSDIAPGDIFQDQILSRVILSIVNEAAHILTKGHARKGSDIDVVAVTGLGWPRHEGGPLYWADTQGLGNIQTQLAALQNVYGDDFDPGVIARVADSGSTLTQYGAQR